MSKNSKNYTKEFKDMIYSLYQNGKSQSELVSEYGLSKASVCKWINERKEIKVDDEKISALEVKKLKLKIKELEEENDILKKVMTIFAKK